MEQIKVRALTDLLVPNLFRSEKHNESYVKLRQEYDSCEKWCPSTSRAMKKGEGLDFVRWRQNSLNFRTIAIIWHNSNPLTMSLLWHQFDSKGLLGSQKMRTHITIEWTYCMIFILWLGPGMMVVFREARELFDGNEVGNRWLIDIHPPLTRNRYSSSTDEEATMVLFILDESSPA